MGADRVEYLLARLSEGKIGGDAATITGTTTQPSTPQDDYIRILVNDVKLKELIDMTEANIRRAEQRIVGLRGSIAYMQDLVEMGADIRGTILTSRNIEGCFREITRLRRAIDEMEHEVVAEKARQKLEVE